MTSRLSVADLVEPLRAAVEVAPPPPVNSTVWPFGGEYWKDELRYYSAPRVTSTR